jgi:hypothetical protein
MIGLVVTVNCKCSIRYYMFLGMAGACATMLHDAFMNPVEGKFENCVG